MPDWIKAFHPTDALIRESSSIIWSHSTGSTSRPPTSRASIALKTPASWSASTTAAGMRPSLRSFACFRIRGSRERAISTSETSPPSVTLIASELEMAISILRRIRTASTGLDPPRREANTGPTEVPPRRRPPLRLCTGGHLTDHEPSTRMQNLQLDRLETGSSGSPGHGDRGRSSMAESSLSGPSRLPAITHDLRETSDERRASGRAARKRAQRGTLGYWTEEDRGHDALETILAQSQIRVPELVPIRHHRMAVSAWNYYRGAAAVMAGDLSSQPDSGLMVQLCGDAHVLNFGLWATPERNLSFDLRDFDETLPGPFEWDIKRFAASLVVAAQGNLLDPARADAAVTAGVEAYRRRMRRYAATPELDIWYDAVHAEGLIGYFEPADRGRVSIHIER